MKNLLLLAAAGMAAAGTQASESRSLAGFYVGLNGGAVLNMGTGEFSVVESGEELAKARDSKKQVTFGIFGGYNYMINDCVLLGLEGYVQLMPKNVVSKKKRVDADETVRFKAEQAPLFGAALRAGYMINKNTLLYVRLGLEHYKHSMELTAYDCSEEEIDETTIKKTPKSGFRANIGTGVEYYVNPKMFVGCEYRYGLKKTVRGQTEDGKGAAELTGSQHFLLAKVGYKF